MPRSDLVCDLIKYGLANDSAMFRKAAEAISAEERAKQHTILAAKIDSMLRQSEKSSLKAASKEYSTPPTVLRTLGNESGLYTEKVPHKRLEQLILPEHVQKACKEMIEEQFRAELLQSYGLEPRNRLLLIGPPGNGKTSLAEAIAEALSIPLLTVCYESIIGSYLGETASRLSKLFEYAKARECVLFFDEFETLGKERGDLHETGEIKRVVSSLLMQIDSLPSHVIVVAATNHDSLLDKAAWRRFQIRLELPKPTQQGLEEYYRFFEKERGFQFGVQEGLLAEKTVGVSYAEAEEFALSVFRQYVLSLSNGDATEITEKVLQGWQSQAITKSNIVVGVETSTIA